MGGTGREVSKGPAEIPTCIRKGKELTQFEACGLALNKWGANGKLRDHFLVFIWDRNKKNRNSN